MVRLEVRPEAELDVAQAMLWYERERDGLGDDFVQAVRATFIGIEEGPLQFPIVWQTFRRAIVHRFPFGVFFVLDAELATVMAIMHFVAIRNISGNASDECSRTRFVRTRRTSLINIFDKTVNS